MVSNSSDRTCWLNDTPSLSVEAVATSDNASPNTNPNSSRCPDQLCSRASMSDTYLQVITGRLEYLLESDAVLEVVHPVRLRIGGPLSRIVLQDCQTQGIEYLRIHPPYKSLQVVCLIQPCILLNELGEPHGRLSTSGKIRRVDLLKDTNQNIIAKIKKLSHVFRITLAPFEVM
jgi:hypothetical protein